MHRVGVLTATHAHVDDIVHVAQGQYPTSVCTHGREMGGPVPMLQKMANIPASCELPCMGVPIEQPGRRGGPARDLPPNTPVPFS